MSLLMTDTIKGVKKLLKWTEDLSTGIGVIDDRHKELFKRVNSLLSSMSQGKGKEQMGEALGFLSDYVVTHFGTGEQFMRAHGYPGLQIQRVGSIRGISSGVGYIRTRWLAAWSWSLQFPLVTGGWPPNKRIQRAQRRVESYWRKAAAVPLIRKNVRQNTERSVSYGLCRAFLV